MVERVEDMQLPNAVVQRIIKEALPDGINVAKDARSEISKAASIFVLYLTSSARQKTQKKTLAPGDVLSALEGMEMEHFVEPLKRAMEQYKRQQKNKRDKKQPSTATAESNDVATEELNAVEEEEEVDTEFPETEEDVDMLLDAPTDIETADTELPDSNNPIE